MTDSAQQPETTFSLEKIYVKDVSYEAPSVPAVFVQESNAGTDIGMQLGIDHAVVAAEHGLYEVVLTITVTAGREKQNVFLVEVKQAGLFRIGGVDRDTLQRVLAVNCPAVLLPFVRETIDDLVGKGGFPQLLIAPINFEALYQQRQAAAAPA